MRRIFFPLQGVRFMRRLTCDFVFSFMVSEKVRCGSQHRLFHFNSLIFAGLKMTEIVSTAARSLRLNGVSTYPKQSTA